MSSCRRIWPPDAAKLVWSGLLGSPGGGIRPFMDGFDPTTTQMRLPYCSCGNDLHLRFHRLMMLG